MTKIRKLNESPKNAKKKSRRERRDDLVDFNH